MGEDYGSYRVFVPPRPLTNEERKLLTFMLDVPFPGRDELQRQLPHVRVSAECGCGIEGCPVRILWVPPVEGVAPAPVGRRVPVTARGHDRDGMFIQVLVHVVDGWLDELEAWRGDLGPFLQFPDPAVAELQRQVEV
jgi:hypothetical protein